MHIFLDDGWAIERDRQVCSSVSKAVKIDLGEAGFITNDEKSIWKPCQRIDWSGLTWDSAQGTIEIVERRCAKILRTIDSIVDSAASLFLPEIWHLSEGKLFLHHQFPGTSPQS